MGIDLNRATDWQFRDSDGSVLPWFTRPCLDYLLSLDLSEKVVWEWGLGSSSLFWVKKCKALYGVDSNPDYVQAVKNATDHRAIVWYEEGQAYINKPAEFDFKFDIMVIDGIFREECVPVALSCLNPGSILIYDNWMQPSVSCQSEETKNILLNYKHDIYPQNGHSDWKTAIFFI